MKIFPTNTLSHKANKILERNKENVLFNDALYTFYLRLNERQMIQNKINRYRFRKGRGRGEREMI